MFLSLIENKTDKLIGKTFSPKEQIIYYQLAAGIDLCLNTYFDVPTTIPKVMSYSSLPLVLRLATATLPVRDYRTRGILSKIKEM